MPAGRDNDVLTSVASFESHGCCSGARGQRAFPQPPAGLDIEGVDCRVERAGCEHQSSGSCEGAAEREGSPFTRAGNLLGAGKSSERRLPHNFAGRRSDGCQRAPRGRRARQTCLRSEQEPAHDTV